MINIPTRLRQREILDAQFAQCLAPGGGWPVPVLVPDLERLPGR
jgi:hypothetical protein